MVNLPVPLTSFVPTAARLSNAALQSLGFRPVAVAMAFTMPDFVIPAAFLAGAIAPWRQISCEKSHSNSVSQKWLE